jgi:hypothetical protein
MRLEPVVSKCITACAPFWWLWICNVTSDSQHERLALLKTYILCYVGFEHLKIVKQIPAKDSVRRRPKAFHKQIVKVGGPLVQRRCQLEVFWILGGDAVSFGRWDVVLWVGIHFHVPVFKIGRFGFVEKVCPCWIIQKLDKITILMPLIHDRPRNFRAVTNNVDLGQIFTSDVGHGRSTIMILADVVKDTKTLVNAIWNSVVTVSPVFHSSRCCPLLRAIMGGARLHWRTVVNVVR